MPAPAERFRAVARGVLLVSFALAFVDPGLAHAGDDEDELCLASSIQGQVLRRSGRLLRAREHLEACAQDVCESHMRERCAAWRREVEAETPRLHYRVEDDRGVPQPTAEVHLDGTEAPSSATVALDPGRHVLRADLAGRRATLDVDLGTGTNEARLIVDLRAHVARRPTPWPVYGLGGLAAAAAIASSAFGTSAIVQTRHLRSCAPYCEPDRQAPLHTALRGADISGIVAATALVAAIFVYLARPTVLREVRIGADRLGWSF